MSNSHEKFNFKVSFLLELNIDRGYKRRRADNISSMTQPFNEIRFNFTKLTPEEKIMNLSNRDQEDIIVVKVSLLEYYHCLFLLQRHKKLP